MGLYTKIIEKDGTITTIKTQECMTGTYVMINNDFAKVLCTEETEIDYHIRIRDQAIKRGATISKYSSIIN